MMDKRLRVLRVTPSFASEEFHGSGLNAYYHTVFSKLNNRVITEWKNATYLPVADDVKVFAINIPSVGLAPPASKGLKKNWIFLKKIVSTFIFLMKARERIDAFRPDVVHVYTPIHILTGLYCKCMFKSKLVLSLHGTDVLRIKKSKLLRNLIKKLDYVFLLSKKMASDLAMDEANISYLGNGFDNSIYFHAEKKREKLVLSVGNLRWQKDYKTLIKAFAYFKAMHSDYRLVIVGDGELREELESFAISEGVGPAVDFEGSISAARVSLLMQKADIFALASVSEGSPKVILEALASGLPIAATSVGDIPALVRDGGYCCPPQEPKLLSKCMSQCMDLTKTMRRKDLAKLVEHKSWSSISRVLDARYKQIVNLG